MRFTPLLFIILIVLTAIVSWVGSIYGQGMHSLLDGEGLRWVFTHVIANLRVSPWCETVMGLSVLGLLTESELPQVFMPRFWQRGRRSLKKLRALQVTLAVFIVLLLITLYFVLAPASPVLSAFGHFSRSPFYYGLYPFILVSLTLLSITYGSLSGRFLSLSDTVQAMVALPVGIAPYFVSFFLASQFVACFHYMLDAPLLTPGQLLMADDSMASSISLQLDFTVYVAVYGIPLLTSLLKYYIKH